MRPILILALLALCRPAAAQFIVQPGDTGELDYAIHNDSTSIGPVSGVVMTVDTGAVVRILSSGPALASTLQPDDSVTFSFIYEIPADAPGGVALVKLQPAASTVNLLPPMAALRADLEVSVTPEPIRAFDQTGSSQPLMEALFPQAPWLRAESLRFLLWDPDGVAGFDLLRGPGPVFELAFSTEMTNLPLNAAVEVPQALLLDSSEFYVARINGGLGGVIDRYFLLDRNPPTIDLVSAVFDPASGLLDLSGAALDAGSGIASVAKVLDPPGPGDGPPAYTGPTYPPGASPTAIGESGLSTGRYYFLARDRSSLAPPVGGTLVDSQFAAAGGACSRPGPPPNVPFFLGNGGHMLDSVFLNVDFRLANPSLQAAYNEGRLAFSGGAPSDIGTASVVLRSSSPGSGAPLPGAWGVASSVSQTGEQTVLTASSLGPHTVAQSLPLAPVVTSEIRVTSNTTQVGGQLTTYDAQGTPTVTPITIPPGGIYPFTPPEAACDMRSASVTGFDEDSAKSIPVLPSDAAHISLDGISLDVPSFTSPGSVMVARVPFEPPPGYFRTSLVRDILLTAGYNPPLKITMPHEVEMPFDLLAKSEMWHLSNGTLSRISTAVDAFKATGETASTSLFFLAIRDALPPETTVQFQGPSVTVGREVPVISGAAQVALSASDPTDGDSVATGVSGTYFLVDEVLVDSTTTPPLRFSSPFSLQQGRHMISFTSIDRVGNAALPDSASVDVDATAPSIAVVSSAPFFASARPTLSAAFTDSLAGLSTANLHLELDGAPLPAGISYAGGGSLGSWTSAGALYSPLTGHGFVAYNGWLYAIGGFNGSAVSDQVRFAKINADGTAGPWAATATLPEPRLGFAAAAANGFLYVMDGGNGTVGSSVFYTRINADGSLVFPWKTGNSLPAALQDTDGVAVIAQDAYLFVIGGYQSDRVYSTTIGADGAPGIWAQLTTPLPKVLRQTKAVALGDKIYLMGGMTSDALTSNINETYIGQVLAGGDVTSWVRGPDLPLATSFAAAAAADGRILYGGGFLPDNSITDRTFTARVEGAGLSAWEEGPQAPYPAYRPGIAAESGRFFWAGGQRQGGSISNGLFTAAVNPGGVALATATADAADLAEGPHEARAEAADRAGNTAFTTSTFFVDLTPPDTQLVVAAASRTMNGNLYVLGITTVSFSATDGPEGAASGVAQTLFTVDAGTEAPAGEFVSLPADWSTIRFRSVDAVGNAEALKSLAVKLDTAAPAAVADLAGTALSSASVRFTWTGAGDDASAGDIADAEVRLDLRSDAAAFSTTTARVVLASGTLSQAAQLSFAVGGLAPGSNYRAAVFARDTAGNWSAASNEAAVQTFFLAESTNAVAQLYSSDPGASVTVVPTTAQPSAYTVALASGLQPVAEFYELSAVITPESPAHLVFFLDAAYDLTSLAIYTFDTLTGTWISSPIINQDAVLLADGRIQVSGDLTHASLYAVMVRDTAPPITSFSVLGSSAVLDGNLFAGKGSSGVLTAQDLAPVGGVASGLAATLYRGGADPENAFIAPFALPSGAVEVFFHSIDKSGNSELEKSAAVFIDAAPPAIAATANMDAGTLSVTAEDNGSGLGSFSIVLDGGPVLVEVVLGAVHISTTLALTPGTHVLHAAATDRLGQAATLDRTFASDAVPPAVAFSFPRPDETGLCRLAQGPVQVRGTVYDASLASWNLSEGAAFLGSGSANIDGPLRTWDAAGKTGSFTLYLSASDAAGQTASASLTLHAGQPTRTLALGGKKALDKPRGVAWAPNRIYVADTNADLVRVFDGAGNLLTSFGDKRRSLKLNKPAGLAVDGAGNIFVADANNKRVVKLSAAGNLLQEFGGKRTLEKPVAVALAGGNILVADAHAGEVVVFSDAGTVLRRVPLPSVPGDHHEDDEDEDEARPMALASEGSGAFWVADAKGRRVLRYDAAFNLVQTIPGFARPEGLAVSPSGACLAVVDSKAERVRTFDAARGTELATFGKDSLHKPAQAVFTADGQFLVANRNDDQVTGFGLPGTPIVIAMTQPKGGYRASGVDETSSAPVVARVGRVEGGFVEEPGGASVEVPAGAVAQDLDISVAVAPEAGVAERAAQNLSPASSPRQFGPHGQNFTVPVTITLPYDEHLIAGARPDELKIHYWNAERSAWEALASRVDMDAHTVSAQTSHFSLYQVLVPIRTFSVMNDPEATFALRSVYAFPNPAVGGQRPTIHVAVGKADRVTIRIYDIAGTPAHETTLDGSPSIVNDDTGAHFAYEYSWAGHIPSGVYLYTITAEKAGNAPIKRVGKLAVVR